MDKSPWEAKPVFSYSKYSLHFMEPEGSLLHSEGPTALPILSQLDPEHTPISHFLKTKLLSECPITHISRICTHTTMKVLMFYQITMFTDCLMTLISYMHTHHYVSVHVLPENTSLHDLLLISQANMHSLLRIRCFTRMLHWPQALLHTSQV